VLQIRFRREFRHGRFEIAERSELNQGIEPLDEVVLGLKLGRKLIVRRFLACHLGLDLFP
jgi:hypothetical protein